MPSPDHADPQAAYAIQSALVDLAIASLRRALEAHEACPRFDAARVEELAEVERQLVAITALVVEGTTSE